MTSKPKLNQPDVESTITSPIGESLNINFTIPSKQFEQVFEKDTNIEKRNVTLEEVKKEWNNIGWDYKTIDEYVLLINKKDKEKRIIINDILKRYFVAKGYITFQEHQLLTKTFKALGWGGYND